MNGSLTPPWGSSHEFSTWNSVLSSLLSMARLVSWRLDWCHRLRLTWTHIAPWTAGLSRRWWWIHWFRLCTPDHMPAISGKVPWAATVVALLFWLAVTLAFSLLGFAFTLVVEVPIGLSLSSLTLALSLGFAFLIAIILPFVLSFSLRLTMTTSFNSIYLHRHCISGVSLKEGMPFLLASIPSQDCFPDCCIRGILVELQRKLCFQRTRNASKDHCSLELIWHLNSSLSALLKAFFQLQQLGMEGFVHLKRTPTRQRSKHCQSTWLGVGPHGQNQLSKSLISIATWHCLHNGQCTASHQGRHKTVKLGSTASSVCRSWRQIQRFCWIICNLFHLTLILTVYRHQKLCQLPKPVSKQSDVIICCSIFPKNRGLVDQLRPVNGRLWLSSWCTRARSSLRSRLSCCLGCFACSLCGLCHL